MRAMPPTKTEAAAVRLTDPLDSLQAAGLDRLDPMVLPAPGQQAAMGALSLRGLVGKEDPGQPSPRAEGPGPEGPVAHLALRLASPARPPTVSLQQT